MSFPMEDYGILADGTFGKLPQLAHPVGVHVEPTVDYHYERSLREEADLKAAGEPDIKWRDHRLAPVEMGREKTESKL
ncbi:hypothetical protein B0A48_07604 [Cryoendolithus antarcticus]|uniref:Uncharacterized protein n=1 Tax=Cryoendolithus antarcticus TaxID=1507870 RepID=A0A1V8T730_9PEZI|nr:hypothetical protein B0A48_07604 [Cryoendolithus antarcticus]